MLLLNVERPVKPPRVELFPEASDFDAATEALDIAEFCRLDLDDWQKWALFHALGRNDGVWAAFESGLVIPRQNGKTELIIARLLAGLFSEIEQPRLLMYTAHEYKTAREVFNRLAFLLDPPSGVNPELVADQVFRDEVERVRRANGEEAVELRDGRRLRLLARTSGSGRGFTGDLVVLDEAQHLTPDHMGALLPTLSARPNPQVWYAAAGPLDHSDVQRGVRDRALAGAESLAYVEYSVPDDLEDLDDEGALVAANPAHPHRISLEHIRKERGALGEEEYARERLCFHGSRHHAVIPADVWAKVTAPSKISGAKTFAVDVPPERSSTSIAMAGPAGDNIHVEIVEYRPGTEWAVDWLADKAKKHRANVLLDPASAAGSLITGLAQAGVEPVLVSGREMAQACGQFHDAVRDGRLVHHPGPHATVMVEAVDAARRRTMGDAWAWHRRDTAADISPLVAATLAMYGVSKKPPKRSGSWTSGVKVPCKCGCGAMTETGFATKACKTRFEESDAA